jgi:cytochrome c oxidase subunit 2
VALLAALPLPRAWAAGPSPMDYLWTNGPSVDPVTRLNWGLITISVAVMTIIAAMLLYACLRRRPPLEPGVATGLPGRMPVQPDNGGLSWVYIGVGISTVVLFASTVWTLRVLAAVAAPTSPTLSVEITAHQWWWEARYPDPEPGRIMVTANEIHIPVGEPVHVKLMSDDVIHSFWIPKLGGKTDVIPGQTNYSWLQADQPGEYRGQCAEFCGPQHAHMALYVIAEDRGSFERWRQRQLQASVPPSQQLPQLPQLPQLAQLPLLAQQGSDVFISRCSVCHTVRGTPAAGRLGPDLTHLMSRRTIASGMLPNNVGGLSGWVADAQAIKPGARMPTMDLSPQELHAVVDYLETLQ